MLIDELVKFTLSHFEIAGSKCFRDFFILPVKKFIAATVSLIFKF